MSEPIRVLLVDDEESFRIPMMERLTQRGFQVEEAASGPESLVRARSCGGDYDVAIIDQVMGPPNGIETMRQLHQLYPAIEVIILTGWGDMEPGEKAMEMGAYRYMSKPVSVKELALNIRTAARLGQERQRRLALQALVRAGQEISGVQSEENLYQRLYEQARELLPELDGFVVSHYDEQNRVVSFPFCYVRRERLSLSPRRDGNGITEFVLQRKEPLLLPEGDEAFRREHGLKPPHPKLGCCSSEIAVPMFLEGRVLGTINARTYQADVRYTQEHVEVLQAFANQAAVIIQNVRHLEEAKIWQELDRQIATCSSPKTAYQLFARQAQRALDADFAVFYPYDPTAPPEKPRFMQEDCVQVGDLRTTWQPPLGGIGGGVHRALDKAPDGLFIVNDLEGMERRLRSHLAEREGVKAFIALRLEVVPEGQTESRTAGMLFLNFRRRTAFKPAHLVGLQLAGSRIAAVIQRLHLLAALQEERQQLNRRLRAIVDIFQVFRERRNGHLILEHIAEAAKEALKIDVCTLLEYDPKKGEFKRGAAGLELPETNYTLPNEFKSWFMDRRGPTVIPDVQQDERMRDSAFVQREDIQSTIIYPLRIEDQSLGLLFASYRYHKEPASDEQEAIGLFADLAALVVHEARLREELGRTQRRLERRLFLDWVSMLEASWQHSLTQKAATILNYTAALQNRLDQCYQQPPAMAGVSETIKEIDRLAREIASAPPRVPQSWEMEAELIPLAPLLEEVAQREGKRSLLRASPPMEIRTEVEALGGVQVRGYRRWLIYALEALLQNARNAMLEEGTVIITSQRAGKRAEIRIQDTGSGVPEAIRCKLFKELVPKEQDRAGMGIGGLLAATIIEEHEGSIELEKPGPGDTTVLISLPVVEGAEL